ncbi:MAG TPA: Mur ligase family protein, partial [Patescibacteria group bacterium]|nr:Mur ligase family protein [Patescibacteria group bacterium]
MELKKIGKSFLCNILESQVNKLKAKYNFKIVAVCGSVGKTSTKLAIANLLQNNTKVLYQDGNYNDRLTVPLINFNRKLPNLFNIFAWILIYIKNEQTIRRGFPFDLVIVELGTDAPGQISKFKYLKPDITVITAVAAEHMVNFDNLDEVAKEELRPLEFSNQALLNIEDIPVKYLPDTSYKSYGTNKDADYRLELDKQDNLSGQFIKIDFPKNKRVELEIKLLGHQGAKAVVAAAAVADILGWNIRDIKEGLSKLTSIPGRMQILSAINNSIIIDDTYNSSPIATKAALDVLYGAKYKNRIAILGSMNELGPISQTEHEEIGKYCDPNKLNLVVTIGLEAKKYIAPVAKKNGCQVVSYLSPYEAGEYVKKLL